MHVRYGVRRVFFCSLSQSVLFRSAHFQHSSCLHNTQRIRARCTHSPRTHTQNKHYCIKWFSRIIYFQQNSVLSSIRILPTKAIADSCFFFRVFRFLLKTFVRWCLFVTFFAAHNFLYDLSTLPWIRVYTVLFLVAAAAARGVVVFIERIKCFDVFFLFFAFYIFVSETICSSRCFSSAVFVSIHVLCMLWFVVLLHFRCFQAECLHFSIVASGISHDKFFQFKKYVQNELDQIRKKTWFDHTTQGIKTIGPLQDSNVDKKRRS